MLRRTDATQLAAAADALVRREMTDASEATRERLVTAITNVLIEHVSVERNRAVLACRKRAEVWRTTPSASSSLAQARDEARARANEAAYLADLLESGDDLPAMVM